MSASLGHPQLWVSASTRKKAGLFTHAKVLHIPTSFLSVRRFFIIEILSKAMTACSAAEALRAIQDQAGRQYEFTTSFYSGGEIWSHCSAS